ncbi:hypothetical protein DFR52_1011048 [Hoeflea marina]|uniref:Autotransporter domain-containing protein n=1 Tax=Hoeflea marina TaxID=274592 RepID=A0A317PSA1_9HYPH|nr:autotransporter outer membrane beta-barrel domain-containing protein [Hoeflea marina]PWW04351.1 hypothetical protein DFR52_1011048 [Hoeflea marina]
MSRLAASTAIGTLLALALAASGTSPADAEDFDVYHDGTLHYEDFDGGSATLVAASDINVRQAFDSKSQGTVLVDAFSTGRSVERSSPTPPEPGGSLSVTQAGTLISGNANAIYIDNSAAAVRVNSTGGDGRNATAGEEITAGIGANGGAVSVTNSGSITSDALLTYGIHAVSDGGQGGSGDGSHYGDSLGGNGGSVGVTNAGTIVTLQARSHGILAQSLGGTNGSAQSFWQLLGKHKTGGAVTVTLSALSGGGRSSVSTAGDRSNAIVAQSVGGGDMDLVVVDGQGSGSGSGGAGGHVTVDIGGNAVSTAGNLSIGVVAQSIGGSSGVAAKGQTGANGGYSGAVDFRGAAGSTVETHGLNSDAVLLQAIGGSGGAGGFDTGSVAIGGNGGEGGAGGTITAATAGALTTHGDHSLGLLAQSIAGGGGRGGNADATAVFVAVAVGGNGGAGGQAGSIGIGVGDITTAGAFSHGVSALSIGGGGGHGGTATATATAPVFASATAVGGSGGTGGNGGAVTLDLNGAIRTGGDHSIGALAESIGGGGSGGSARALSAAAGPVAVSVAVAIGGHGGNGGVGGTVRITNHPGASVATQGDFSTAIAAYSIGGGGGNGGGAQSISLAVSAGETAMSGAIAVSIGGTGGSGGQAGGVTVSSDGSVSTAGTFAFGVQALSVGGGGGHGGSSMAAAAAISTGQTLAVSVGLGGNGGTGGHGGTATVNLGAGSTITTGGDHAIAVLAQSIGGGGGSGGSALTLSGTASLEAGANTVSVALGGHGGAGGDGNIVGVSSAATIGTSGAFAHGVFAQSVGGGGGAGGNSLSAAVSAGMKSARSMAVTVGGNGGNGGTGGAVTVTNTGIISVAGQLASGIVAQSVGGSGGAGGSSESVTAAIKASEDASGNGHLADGRTVSISVGGNGGAGGRGGAVTVTSGNDVTVGDDGGVGIFAQSVGGGGGSGGHADSVFLSAKKGGSANNDGGGFSTRHLKNLTVALGGRVNSAGDGGAVTVTHASGHLVSTAGDSGFAILAQSIGGGGGVSAAADNLYFLNHLVLGGDSVAGFGKSVTVTNSGSLQTSGLFASAIVAQSIGGGGGVHMSSENLRADFLEANTVAESSGQVDLGGTIAMGTGGAVTVGNTGTVSTGGDFAIGILAQSIGGGGGLATVDNDSSSTAVRIVSFVHPDAGFTTGASTVSVTHGGAISTAGLGAVGILAQSIGGGGGLVQAASAVTDHSAAAGEQAVWGLNTGGGSAAAVTVTQGAGASIRTAGDGAVGILAQSLAGGGGLIQTDAGTLVEVAHLFNLTTGAGDAGGVSISQHGAISTQGRYADGIRAISGGNTRPGDISITVNGSIATSGNDLSSVYAGLRGNSPAAGITSITVADGGSVSATGINADAIVIDDATHSMINMATVTNSGTITSAQGNAIRSNQFLHVINANTIGGSVEAAGARQAYIPWVGTTVATNAAANFENQLGGWFSPGAKVDLGAYHANELIDGLHMGLLSNAGAVAPGGEGAVMHTALTGRYESAASALFFVDLDMDRQDSDRLTASSGMLFNGTVRPNLLSLGPNASFVIAAAPTGTGLASTATVMATPAVSYTIGTASLGGQDVVQLAVTGIDFDAPGLSANDSALAKLYNARLATGNYNTDPALVTLANAPVLSLLEYALDSYSADHLVSETSARTMAATGFQNSVFSCGVADGDYAAILEGECNWTRISYRWSTRDGGTADARKDRTFGFSAGLQRAYDEHWRFGLAGGFETVESVAANAETRSDLVHLGVVAKYQQDNWLFGASIAAGHGWSDTSRTIPLDAGLTALASHGSDWIQARIRAAYLFDNDGWYLKPLAEVDVNLTRTDAYRETGAEGYNLAIDGGIDRQVAINAGLEFGSDHLTESGMKLRTFGYGGLRYTPEPGRTIDVSINGGAETFSQSYEGDRLLGSMAAGFKLFDDSNLSLDARYEGQYGRDVVSHGLSLKMQIGF